MLNPEISLNRRLPERIARNGALSRAAKVVQPLVRGWRDGGGAALKNVLNGTVLGHPLHPVLTDIPIGAWTVTAVLDAIELAGGPDVAFASDASLAVGLAGGVGAILTGFADWADTDDDPRTLGMGHALLNGTAFVAYVGSLRLRREGRRSPGIALSMLGYALSSFAGYLGGELAFNYGLGVKHTATPLSPPEEFVAVLPVAQLSIGGMARVEAHGVPILLLRTIEGVHAISAVCTHRGAPLEEGTLEDGDCVRCPWHGSIFSFRDGGVLEGPACFPQARFEARIAGADIEVRASI